VSDSYKAVQDALAEGADPAMLCTTCPWDRYCISPPSMTRAEVDKLIKQASEQDEQHSAQARREGKQAPMPVGSLLAAVTFAGRDTMGELCPVFALRLRSSKGRGLVDGLKETMKGWDDQS